jgi:methylmalonyl-CoA/ethylmalonyl-CoA epimerase
MERVLGQEPSASPGGTQWKISHIGVVVKDIEQGIEDYAKLYNFSKRTEVIRVDNQGVSVVLLNCGNDCDVELICPIDDRSPAYNSLTKGGGLNHICYEVADFDGMAERQKRYVVRTPRPSPQALFQGRRTFFTYRRTLGGVFELTEFVEAAVK